MNKTLVFMKRKDEDSYEVTITARIEDIPAIERRLAPYV